MAKAMVSKAFCTAIIGPSFLGGIFSMKWLRHPQVPTGTRNQTHADLHRTAVELCQGHDLSARCHHLEATAQSHAEGGCDHRERCAYLMNWVMSCRVLETWSMRSNFFLLASSRIRARFAPAQK